MYQKTLTREQMEERGWEFGPPRPCSHCSEPIFWGKNPDNGRNYSFDLHTTSYHVKRCNNSQTAAKPAASTYAAIPRRPAPPSTQPAAPAQAVDALQGAIAELVVAVRALTAALLPPSNGFARRATGDTSLLGGPQSP